MDVTIPVNRTGSPQDEFVVVDLIDVQRLVHVQKGVRERGRKEGGGVHLVLINSAKACGKQ